MKKITLLIALFCSVSAFSVRYLVEGTTGTNSWRIAGSGEVNVTTNNFSSWYYGNQYAIDGTDEIWVAGGTYVLSGTFGARKVNLYGGFAGTENSISERSKVSGGKPWEFSSPTIFDGNNTCPQGFNTIGLPTTITTYIDGVTITKCQITNVSASVFGVGAHLIKGVVMRNCIVSNNTYNNTAPTNQFDCYGGGIYLAGGHVIDSYIGGNKVIQGNGRGTAGGGILFAYTSEDALNVVSGCTIENNMCTTYGGGIEIVNGTGGTIENCIIKGNTCSDRGAGLGYTNIVASAGTSELKILNNQFIENTSSTYGGGVALNFGTAATTIFEGNSIIGNTGVNAGGMYIGGGGKYAPIKNCIFRDNKSTDTSNSANSAGALYCNTPNAVIQNCVFVNNSSKPNTNTNSTVKLLNLTNKLYNCTFANNSDEGAAGYTVHFGGQVQTITNNVFWGNNAIANFFNASQSVSTYNATTADKNTTGSVDGGSVGNITTLTLNPNNTFVTPTTFAGSPTDAAAKAASAVADWRLIDNSPAVDAGKNLTSDGVTNSIDGEERPLGNAFDMGAYETSKPTGVNHIFTDKNFCFVKNNFVHVTGLRVGEVVSVFNTSGSLIYKKSAISTTLTFTISKGVYIIRATDKAGKIVVK